MKKAADELLCVVCRLPCREAQISDCNHAYCLSCLEARREPKSEFVCQECNKKVFITFPKHQIDNEVGKLEVYCPYKPNGCEWIGNLRDVDEHVNSTNCVKICHYCEEYIHSSKMLDHVATDCPCYCQYCYISASKQVISGEHKGNCYKFPKPKEVISNKNNKSVCSLLNSKRLLIILCIVAVIVITLDVNHWLQKESNVKVKELREYLSFLYKSRPNTHKTTWSSNLDHLSEAFLRRNQVAPVIIKISNITKKLEDKHQWSSVPFFAFENGYQMCQGVYVAGFDSGEDTHISVYLYLMKGAYDDDLQELGYWPMRGTFTIELLNQLFNFDHHIHHVTFDSNICEGCANRVMNDSIVQRGWGKPQFIPHTSLNLSNNTYLLNDTLYFRISYQHMQFNYYYMEYLLYFFLAGVCADLVLKLIDQYSSTNTLAVLFTSCSSFTLLISIGYFITCDLLGAILWTVMIFVA